MCGDSEGGERGSTERASEGRGPTGADGVSERNTREPTGAGRVSEGGAHCRHG